MTRHNASAITAALRSPWSTSKFDSRGTALRVEMNGAAPRSRQSSGTCDKCAISELPPEVRSAGQCIEEAFRERLLLSDLKRLWARQSRDAALGRIFERHRIFVFREAERHEEGVKLFSSYPPVSCAMAA